MNRIQVDEKDLQLVPKDCVEDLKVALKQQYLKHYTQKYVEQGLNNHALLRICLDLAYLEVDIIYQFSGIGLADLPQLFRNKWNEIVKRICIKFETSDHHMFGMLDLWKKYRGEVDGTRCEFREIREAQLEVVREFRKWADDLLFGRQMMDDHS